METVVSAMFGVVLEKLGSAGVEQFMKLLKKGKKTDKAKIIKEWKVELSLIQAILNDAEQNQSKSTAVKLWLDDLKDFACDLEDTLDDFVEVALVDGLKKRGRGVLGLSFHDMVGSVLACARGATQQLRYSGPDFSSRIDEICSCLKQLQTRAATLGLSAQIIQQPTYPLAGQQRGRRESTSVISEDIVYGRDEEKNRIIRLLIEDEPNYMNYVVIPIVGMGGIGKTTLAQCLYNDELLKGHFDLKAWVCVSDVFDVQRITKDIIDSATQGNFDCSRLNQAQEKLQEELTGKKFLLVLDDIWSEEYVDWDQLQVPFRLGARGSRVIVTTRNENIANMVMNNYCHSNIIYLKCLSDEDCWCLFKRHAIEYIDLAERKDDIVRKCKGLPLAAKALGGLLRKTMVKSERLRILDSNIWNEESRVLPVLRLSYHHLPSHLKHLFAYCSVFPEDYEFNETEVVLLWMAQGFLPDRANERIEDIGHNCFLDLVSRSLFEECTSPLAVDHKKFTMHDLIHDLAKWSAGDQCCVLDTTNMQKDLKRTRHLYVTRNGIDETFGSQLLVSRLRTFLCSSNVDLNIEILDFVQRFRYVRTLCLASRTIVELPKCIGELKHLQFLKLILRNLEVLPKSIGKLRNLQMLECHCYYLQEVPNIRFLDNLRHLNISECNLREMPQGIGNLINLQNLDEFVLAAGGGSRISELKNLNHLHGKITISGLENVIKGKDAQEAQMHDKKSLDELYLAWSYYGVEVDDNTKRDVLQQLQPHASIKKCELNGYMGLTFPGWLGDPSFTYMVDIRLVRCEKCECLPPLGQLPMLTTLWVSGMNGIKEVGPEFYGRRSTPFPSLKTLRFKSMISWEKWLVHSPVDNNGAFPSLEMLNIKNCDSLQGDLPPLLPSLKTLKICECREMSVSLPSLPLLEVLKIEGCNVLSITPLLPSLKTLEIYECTEMSLSLPSLPLLEVLQIRECKVLSITGDVIFCSKRVILEDISEITGLPGHFPNVCEVLSIVNCQTSPITIDQIPVVLKKLEIRTCRGVQSLEFEDASSLTPCLEEFVVRDCEPIVSIGRIPLKLQSLKIESCEELRVVEFNEQPKGFSGNDEKTLTTEEGVGLSPKASLELPLLTVLHVDDCPSLIALGEGLLLPGLEILNFSDCRNLERLPCELHNLTSLQELTIKNCPKMNSSFPEGGCSTLPNLTEITIMSCHKFESLVGDYPSLTSLSLEDCQLFHFFPEDSLPRNLTSLSISETNIDKPIQEWGLHLLTSLEYLTLSDVGSSSNSVECISDIQLPTSLSNLKIKGFRNLKTISCSTLSNLTLLSIRETNTDKPIQEWGLHLLTSLQYLKLEDVGSSTDSVECISDIHLPTSLSNLKIKGFRNLKTISCSTLSDLFRLSIRETNIEKPIQEWGLHLLTSLQYLTLSNVGSSTDSVECISDIHLPTSLSNLKIKGFRNLKTISFSTIPNLTGIIIKSCPKFESFDYNCLPSQVYDVYIEECDLIEQHLKSDHDGCILTQNGRYSLC